MRGRVSEPVRALALFPAAAAEGGRFCRTKFMLAQSSVITLPLQRLALGTDRLGLRLEGRHHPHVLLYMGDHRDVPLLAAEPLGFGPDVAHIGHHIIRPPCPVPGTVGQTGHEQSAFGNIRRCDPRHERHQQHPPPVAREPQAKRVLFVADKELTLAAFVRPTA